MPAVPGKVSTRISAGLKRFQTILEGARARDVNEADTVTIVKDMLAEVFGYDKYTEITSEYAIRGTYCDLAVKLDGSLATLIEVKAAGLELKDAHVKQAVDYAANQGCEWVLLTNGLVWKVFRVSFAKPIEHELIANLEILGLNTRREEDIRLAWLLSKEGWLKSRLHEYATQQQALSRFTIAALLTTDTLLNVLRREVRRVSPDAKIETEQLRDVLIQDVIKREVLDGEKADSARKLVNRAARRVLRAAGTEESSSKIPANSDKDSAEATGDSTEHIK